MKLSNVLLLGILLHGLVGVRAESVDLHKKMFDAHQQIQLANLEGWRFSKGHDTTWASTTLDDSQWQKLKPGELTSKLADQQGRVEGWFRLEFTLDSSFNSIPLYICRSLWAATDIYLDGDLIHSFGNTNNPYEPFNPNLAYARPIPLRPGEKHLMAIHFVDYETTFTQRELRLWPQNLLQLINITGPEYNEWITARIKNTYLLGSLTVSVSSFFLLLFLMLLFINRGEKIFRLTTFLSLAVVLGAFGTYYPLVYTLSYPAEKLWFILTNTLFLPTMHALTLLMTEWVLRRKISLITLGILLFMPIASGLGHVFNISWPFGFIQMILLGYFGYLIIQSRKTIKPRDWVVVIAMIALTLGSMIWIFLHKYYLDAFIHIENLIKTSVLLSAPTLMLIYVALSYKYILMERKAEEAKVIRITEEKKELLERQNELLEAQVIERTRDLEKTLTNLKATQSQLIQSEKMASLGELTAGIAHEIQNPLNFVNNFSEVNTELIDEMNHEIDKGNLPEVKSIANDIKENQEKITEHGKRADAIVKGMLQHSRSSVGVKEPTDINALADEYLRLAYHGLRAKDKSFNATMKTDYDPSIGLVNVIPQDIGRVILNLITNAFYAVSTMAPKSPKGDLNYEPTVTISTKLLKSPLGDLGVHVSVSDNGPGIPAHIVDKIFQPFFTTKPTGKGTGLGLSLSYDIVKAHGGELKVETKEGEGSVFTILIPVS